MLLNKINVKNKKKCVLFLFNPINIKKRINEKKRNKKNYHIK